MERGCGRTLSRASCDALLRVRLDLFLGPARTCEPAPGRAAGSWAGDMPRLPCFPRALGRCLFRRCCLWLEASNCFLSACCELPGLVARAPTWRSGKVVLEKSPYCLDHLAHLGTREHTLPRDFGFYLFGIAEECGFGRNQPVCELSGFALIRRQLASLYHSEIMPESFD